MDGEMSAKLREKGQKGQKEVILALARFETLMK